MRQITTKELNKYMEDFKTALLSGKVVKVNGLELFVNGYGGYVSIIDAKTNQEIFAK